MLSELQDRLTSIDNRLAYLPRQDAETLRNAAESISIWLARAEAKPYVQRESYVKQIVVEIETIETQLERLAP